jgi:hypothetical protein
MHLGGAFLVKRISYLAFNDTDTLFPSCASHAADRRLQQTCLWIMLLGKARADRWHDCLSRRGEVRALKGCDVRGYESWDIKVGIWYAMADILQEHASRFSE